MRERTPLQFPKPDSGNLKSKSGLADANPKK
jgi:hypothetical protein